MNILEQMIQDSSKHNIPPELLDRLHGVENLAEIQLPSAEESEDENEENNDGTP